MSWFGQVANKTRPKKISPYIIKQANTPPKSEFSWDNTGNLKTPAIKPAPKRKTKPKLIAIIQKAKMR